MLGWVLIGSLRRGGVGTFVSCSLEFVHDKFLVVDSWFYQFTYRTMHRFILLSSEVFS
jgi:hypothetical protein